MNPEEQALRFLCQGSWLYGVLNLPAQARSRGVLIVVGGPQYRAGSHRQFTLLARHLAMHGIPVLRFDYRGMGDSEGDVRNFEDVDDDIRHAIDQFMAAAPMVKDVVIWGLCDAASAALFYAYKDSRVSGLVLLNPWVRTDESMARAYLKHYYLDRLHDPELWHKIFRGKFDYRAGLRSIFSIFGKALPGRRKPATPPEMLANSQHYTAVPLPERMFEGFDRFKGKILLILSGNDLAAKEFVDEVRSSRKWQKLLASTRVQRHDLPDANHTFSQRDWRDQVASWTKEWITSW